MGYGTASNGLVTALSAPMGAFTCDAGQKTGKVEERERVVEARRVCRGKLPRLLSSFKAIARVLDRGEREKDIGQFY